MKQFSKPQLGWNHMVRWLLLALCGAIIGVSVSFAAANSLEKTQLHMPFGYGAAVVLSGSMEGRLSADDLVIIKATDDYAVHDIVVYQDGNSFVIHRIIAIWGDTVITKGDANNVADKPIKRDQIKGKLVWDIAGVGALVRIIRKPVSIVVILAVALLLLELSYRKEQEKDAETLDTIRAEIARLKQEIKH